jgi:hypothetical protein
MIDEVYYLIFFLDAFLMSKEKKNKNCTLALLDMLLKIRGMTVATRVIIQHSG